MKSGTWALLILVAILVGLFVFRLFEDNKRGTETFSGSESYPVKALPVAEDTISQVVMGTGTLIGLHEAVLVAETNGKVRALSAQVGSVLKKGAAIVTLERELKESTRDRAKVTAQKAEADLKRIENLSRAGQVSTSVLEASKLANTTAEVDLQTAQQDLDHTIIRAPFDGTLTARDVDLGMTISPGKSVAEIVDLSTLKLAIEVPERQVALLKTGMAVKVEVPSAGADSLTGEILTIGRKASATSGSYPVEIKVAQNGSLNSGMFARALIRISIERQLVVPVSALIYQDNRPMVYVVEDSTAHAKVVTLGAQQRDRIGIVQGITAGEKVIVAGSDGLREGAPVRIIQPATKQSATKGKK